MTADLDLVLDLSSDNVSTALHVLQEQGLRPRLPVPAEEFADPEIRRRWQRERHLKVFSLHDPADALREVDLLAEAPVPFPQLWEASQVMIVDDVPMRVASIDHLIAMKRAVGRPQDIADVGGAGSATGRHRGSMRALGTPEDWSTDWADVARAQRRAWAQLSAAERLRWLEDALRFAQASGALARERRRRAEALASTGSSRSES